MLPCRQLVQPSAQAEGRGSGRWPAAAASKHQVSLVLSPSVWGYPGSSAAPASKRGGRLLYWPGVPVPWCAARLGMVQAQVQQPLQQVALGVMQLLLIDDKSMSMV